MFLGGLTNEIVLETPLACVYEEEEEGFGNTQYELLADA